MERIKVDGGSFIGADLSRKLLVYEGGAIPNLAGANVDGAQWSFEGAAANTLMMWAYFDAAKPQTAQGFLDHARAQFKQHMKRLPTH